ncbi:MAG: hypothetical protein A2Y33_10405 [Spirochaetes bacterium GWF1_51_8]|nr:MAG: hypothetical protein A2Y33_10405 [Spirochaetes bacterium GWF1_51_8]
MNQALIQSFTGLNEIILSRALECFFGSAERHPDSSIKSSVLQNIHLLLNRAVEYLSNPKSETGKFLLPAEEWRRIDLYRDSLKRAIRDTYLGESGIPDAELRHVIELENAIDDYVVHLNVSQLSKKMKSDRKDYYNSLFINNESVILAIHPDTLDIIDANRSAVDFYGYTRDEFVKLRITDICGLELSMIRANMDKTVKTGHFHVPQLEHYLKNGDRRYVELFLNTVNGETSGPVYLTVHNIHEKVISQRLLTESEQRLTLAMDAADQGLFEFNYITGEVFVSDYFYKIVGYERNEIPSSIPAYIDLVHPEDRGIVEKALSVLMKGKNQSSVEVRIRKKDGTWIWVSASGKVLGRSKSGGVFRYLGIVKDISQEHQVREELDRTNNFLELIFASIPFPLVFLDCDFRIVKGNEIFYRLLNKGISTVQGTSLLNLIEDDEVKEIFGRTARTGTAYYGIREQRKLIGDHSKDGGIWDWNLSPVSEEGGKISGYLFTSVDVTETAKTADALIESKERFKELAESITEIFFVIDKDLDIRYLNKSTKQFFRISRKNLVGSSITEILSKYWDETFFEKFSECFQSGKFSTSVESLLIDNERFFLEVDIYPSKAELFVFMRNISEKIKVMNELLGTNRSLHMMLETSQAIVYHQDEALLMYRTCQIFIERGGYRIAWIGISPEGGENSIKLISHFGDDGGLVKMIEIGLNFGDDPSLVAFRERKTIVIHDLLIDAAIVRWRNAANFRGITSCIFVPMVSEKVPVGVIALFSTQKDNFPEAEVRFIEEISQNLANAILNIRLRQVREKLTRALEDSEQKYRMFVNQAIDGILIYDVEGNLLEMNKKTEDILGSDFPVLHSVNLLNIKPDDVNREFFHELALFYRKIVNNEYSEGMVKEVLWRRKQHVLFIDLTLNRIRYSNKNFVKMTLRDVSPRKESEDKILDYQVRLRDLSHTLSLTEEREKRRLATELHDSIVQNLALSKITLSMIKKQVGDSPVRDSVEKVYQLVDESIRTSRSLVFELSPPILYEFGLIAGLEWLTEQMENKFRVKIAVQKNIESLSITQDMSVALFQIVRELLMNVVKHSGSMAAKLIIKKTDENMLEIVVQDKGKGFDIKELDTKTDIYSGFGLFNVRERLLFFGGDMKIVSHPGMGTSVSLILHLENNGGGIV